MNGKKFELPLYSFYDLKAMERHLEKMAAKGWMLHHITNMGWHYRRAEPRKLHFNVAYYPKASAFEPEPSEGQQTFQEFCDYAGWKLVDSNAFLQIFCNEKENPTPIHTDPETELDSIEGVSKRFVIPAVLFLVIGLIYLVLGVWGWVKDPIGFLADFNTHCTLLLWVMLELYFVIDLGTWFRWKKKARAAAEEGEFLPVRGASWMLGLVLVAAIISLGAQLLSDGNSGLGLIAAIWLGGWVLLYLAVNGIRKMMQRKKVDTETNRAVTILVDVVLAIALATAVIWGSSWAVGHGLFSTARETAMPLVVEDLGGKPDPSYVQECREKSSMFLSDTTYIQHGKPILPWLQYRVLEVRWDGLLDFCMENLLRQKESMGSWQEDYDPEHPYYVYEEMDPAHFGADRAWQLQAYGEGKDEYLLLYGNRIVDLEPEGLLTPEQMKIAGEKLG